MDEHDVMLFALESSRDLGERISRSLEIPLSEHEERDFSDGEHKTRPLVNVRERDVFVVQALYGDDRQTVNDKFCRLLFFLGALKDASAGRVTAVVPYLCYARKDRKTKSRDPVTTRYVARMFDAVDTDRVITMDVHNLAAFQNAFNRRTDHLEAMKLFVEHFTPLVQQTETAVVSPDVGGIKRARGFHDALAQTVEKPISSAFMEKQRSGGVVSGDALVGEVEGRTVILMDDLISSGTTISRAAKACREKGAKQIFAAATHGAFVGDAPEVLADPVLDGVVVTDTIPPFRLPADLVEQKLTVIDVAPFFAQAIRRIHEGGSIVDLNSVSAPQGHPE